LFRINGGVALGLNTTEAVDSIHANLQNKLDLLMRTSTRSCMPHVKESCGCRKPLPGLFEQARACFPDITPETSVMIGDSPSDMEFGRAVGMRTIWIEGYETKRKLRRGKAGGLADASLAPLSEAVEACWGIQ
jgi:HAD superfamily hydrolase (TIGR01662 family)